ncbi:MAG TPA: hypothetical protein VF571_07790 [Pyrinomonadaceae bacterium]|jgi:hypothetical protein
MLVFPDGVTFAASYNLPNTSEKAELLEMISNARIEQGYVAQTVNENLFTCYAEANIDAPQFGKFFNRCAKHCYLNNQCS